MSQYPVTSFTSKSSFDITYNQGGLFSYKYKKPIPDDSNPLFCKITITPFNKSGLGTKSNSKWVNNKEPTQLPNSDEIVISNSKTLGDYIATYKGDSVIKKKQFT